MEHRGIFFFKGITYSRNGIWVCSNPSKAIQSALSTDACSQTPSPTFQYYYCYSFPEQLKVTEKAAQRERVGLKGRESQQRKGACKQSQANVSPTAPLPGENHSHGNQSGKINHIPQKLLFPFRALRGQKGERKGKADSSLKARLKNNNNAPAYSPGTRGQRPRAQPAPERRGSTGSGFTSGHRARPEAPAERWATG